MSDPRSKQQFRAFVWLQMCLSFELAASGYCETDQKGSDGWHASECHELHPVIYSQMIKI